MLNLPKFRLIGLVIALALVIACALGPGTTAAPAVPSNTPAPPRTLQPPPTDQPPQTSDTPAPTVSPTPSGPIVVDDDFSTDSGRFTCTFCTVSGGVLFMGPYPATDSFDAYYAICNDCGKATNYKMSVDTYYVEGPSDRGFGLLLRENDGTFIDLEVTTWQVYGIWNYDPSHNTGYDGWSGLTQGWVSGGLKAGRAVNSVEVIIKTDAGKTTISVAVNGRNVRFMEIPSGSGFVGLLVGLHSISAAFDNFHFEELP